MSTDRIINFLFLLPILLLSMMAHEVAHGWVAHRLGDPTARLHGRLTANPLKHLDLVGTLMFVVTYFSNAGFIFGWAKPVPINPMFFRNRQGGMAVVGLAGPVTNFLIAVLIALFLNFLPIHTLVTTANQVNRFGEILFLGYQVNIVLGIFNLVPIPPLDGSRVLGAFLPPNMYRSWIQLDRYGMFFIILVFVLLQGPFQALLSGGFNLVSSLLIPRFF
jgi:Zn-dependent protease